MKFKGKMSIELARLVYVWIQNMHVRGLLTHLKLLWFDKWNTSGGGLQVAL